MASLSELVKTDPQYRDWYEGESNTARLVKAVVADQDIDKLSGVKLWNLFTLCWWTRADDNWKRIKIPALSILYGVSIEVKSDLRSTVKSAGNLPPGVAKLARQETGFVNFRSVWRQSSQAWCTQHALTLRKLLKRVVALTLNDDDERSLIAKDIAQLPKISSPSGARMCRPELLLTPFIMCLDPQSRFQVLNGRRAVADLLRSMKLQDSPLWEQVEGMLLLIGKYTITDAMMIDSLAASDELRDLAAQIALSENGKKPPSEGSNTPLRYYDDAERESTRKAATIVFRHLHNTMTKSLGEKLAGFSIQQGTSDNCRFDALIKNYNGNGRDLLIEAKPDPDRGSIRIAIGQLFDYKRFLTKPEKTDLALLTIRPPAQAYLDLLNSMQINALWFTGDTCESLTGVGPAWNVLKTSLT